jgi:ribA/ribD-fused uncharacterized protein
MDQQTIYFYDRASDRVKPEHIFLNNYYESPFTLHGQEFKTVEHYYQASKFKGQPFETIRLAASPDEAKRKAHEFEVDLEAWNQKKDQVMREALQAKFSQNPRLKELLVETGDCRLVEDSPRDAYWGGVVDGAENRLGQMLEELREHYKMMIKL